MPLTSEIGPYNPEWPALFEIEQAQISEALGDCISEIHHIGSTAVPDMAAKPEIDLLLIVGTLNDIERIHAGMADLGYDIRGECGIMGRHYYSKNCGIVRTHKAHACERSHSTAYRLIIFRDYMRHHPGDAHTYTALKRRLAETNTIGMAEYLEGKQDFIERIIEKAIDKGYDWK